MSALISCPKCLRHVALPACGDHSVWVRCPLCQAQYPLQEAIDFVPPALEIIPQPGPVAAWSDPLPEIEPLAAESGVGPPPMPMAAAEVGEPAGHVPPEIDEFDLDAAFAAEDAAGIGLAQPGDQMHPMSDEDLDEHLMEAGMPTPADHDLAEHQFTDHAEHTEHHDPDAADLAFADQMIADEMAEEHGAHEPGAWEHAGGEFTAEEHAAEEHAGEEHAAEEGELQFADHEPVDSAAFAGPDDVSSEIGASAFAAMAPAKVKKPVRLAVRLAGLFFFLLFGAFGAVVVILAFLYFGVDPLGVHGYVPKWMNWVLASSLREGNAPHARPSMAGPSTPQTQLADANAAMKPLPNPNGFAPLPDDSAKGQPASPNPQQTNAAPPVPSAPSEPATVAASPAKPAATDVAVSEPNKAAGAVMPKEPSETPEEPPKTGLVDTPKDTGLQPDLGKPPAFDVPKFEPPAVGSAAPAAPAANGQPPAKTAESPAEKPADQPLEKPADKPLEKPADQPVEKPADKPIEKPAEPRGPKATETFSPKDLAAALESAKQSAQALAAVFQQDAVDPELKRLRVAHYKAMSHLATVLTFIGAADSPDEVDADRKEALHLLTRFAAGDAASAEQVGFFSAVWMTSKSRTESGVALAARLQEVVPVGQLFELHAVLEGQKPNPVVLVTDQKPDAEKGSRLLVLGSIVNTPRENLPGYEGSADPVIWITAMEASDKGPDAIPSDAGPDSAPKPVDTAKPPVTEPQPSPAAELPSKSAQDTASPPGAVPPKAAESDKAGADQKEAK